MQFKYKLFGILFFMITLSGCAQTTSTPVPKTYVAHKTSEDILIDGVAKETSWSKASWTDLFVGIQGVKKPKYDTKVKMLWDETYYYIFAQIEEPHVWADIQKHDAIIFHNNDFEIFIDPEGNNHGYYEIEINALNTIWDLFITKPYRELNQPVLNDWHATGLKSAVSVQGTLNNPNDEDKGWTIEIAIPWAVFKTSYFHKNIPKDDFWRINFSRVNWDHQLNNDGLYERKTDKVGKLLHEYNWVWSPQGVINMHEPEKWGYVYFSTKEIGTKDSFTIPKDEYIKWKLFEIYRKQKEHFKKHKKWISSLKEINEEEFTVYNKTIKPTLEKHSQGYNLIVKSPFTEKSIIIKEDGELIVK